MIQTQFQTKIEVFRFDNAKEYFNSILEDYFTSQGIIQQRQSSCIDTPQQNEVAERKNRHLLEVARSHHVHHECSNSSLSHKPNAIQSS